MVCDSVTNCVRVERLNTKNMRLDTKKIGTDSHWKGLNGSTVQIKKTAKYLFYK